MNFDFQELTYRLERFSSARLALRPLCLADAWPLFQASRDQRFNEHLAWDRPEDVDGVVRRLELICKAARRGELTALAAVARDSGEWVSLFRFFPPMDREPGVVEMGIWTHFKFWSGRHSLDLGRMCVDTAFRVSDVGRLIGLAAPGNRGSMHLMRMVGMTERCHSFKLHETGRRLPTVQYEIMRDEWEALKPTVSPFHEFSHSLLAETAEVPDQLDMLQSNDLQATSAALLAMESGPHTTLEDLLLKQWTKENANTSPLRSQPCGAVVELGQEVPVGTTGT